MKKIVLIAVALSIAFSAFSQGQYRNEFSIHGGGGVSMLNYKLTKGSRELGMGGNFGLGYTLFFSTNLGIGTGAEIGFYNSMAKLPTLHDRYMTNDGEYDFEFRSRFSEYEEIQNVMMLNIPIMIQYETSGWHKYYLSGGVRFGLPLKSTYTSSETKFKTTGYYDYWNVELEGPRFMGFGEFEGSERTSNLHLKLSYAASLETGVKWQLENAWSLYTGIYVYYELNNVLKSNEKKKFIEYNAADPSNFETNSVLESNYRESSELRNFTNKASMLTAGIKIRLAIGAGKNLTKEKRLREEEKRKEAERMKEAEEAERLKAKKDQAARKVAEEAARKAEADRKAAEEAARKALIDAEKKAAEAATELARLEAERQAYLKAAKERRKKYASQMNVGYYGLGVMTLTDIQKKQLDREIKKMKAHPNANAKITGHTCSIGSYEVNIFIGQERADVAKDYMVENGIAPSRIETFSKGETEPIVPNTNGENRKKNRRIEIEIKGDN